MAEMGRPLFFALLVITVSFLPIFALTGQEGKLFKPLAWTKTFSMAWAAILAITLTPALAVPFLRGKMPTEEHHPLSKILRAAYLPACNWALEHKKTVLILALLMVSSIPIIAGRLGSEFMPPLNEGTLLYMPTAVPGMSMDEGIDVAHRIGARIMTVPEVKHVMTKVGRADSATDAAPLSMIEAVISFKPTDEWREGMDMPKLISELDQTSQIPGMPNIWWMPIQTRTEMLATGIRSAIGIKVLGADLAQIEEVGKNIETLLKDTKGTRSVFAERSTGGYFIDFDIDRKAIARYGLTVGEVLDALSVAIGGKEIGKVILGRERYPIQIRYQRDSRSNLPDLLQVLVPTPKGIQIPLAHLAQMKVKTGPPMIRDENGRLASFVFVEINGEVSLGDYVSHAKEVLDQNLTLPVGVSLVWAGQYEHMSRAWDSLKLLIPVTFALIFLLIFFNTGSAIETAIVLLAVPFSLIGAFWLLWILGYNLSIAVWVGVIALAGLDAETGVVMLLYLKQSYTQWQAEGKMRNLKDLHGAIIEGAVQRIRPKMMTAGAMLIGLLPIMWAGGVGSQAMKRIAAPMVGGIVTSVALELLIYPVIFSLWKGRKFKKPLLVEKK